MIRKTFETGCILSSSRTLYRETLVAMIITNVNVIIDDPTLTASAPLGLSSHFSPSSHLQTPLFLAP
jgi:hypothetical protein